MAELFDLEDNQDPQDDVNNQNQNLEEDNFDDGDDNNIDAQGTNEPELPEKYKGKSLEEIIRMHQEAEKLIGRQAQEVGETRKLVDQLIQQQINVPKGVEPEAKTQEIDFFEDPTKAINLAVENNPAIRNLQQQAEELRIAKALGQIEKKHPDYMDIANSQEFADWVKASKVRLQLFAVAQNYDVDAADELLSTYKALKGVSAKRAEEASNEMVAQEKQQRKQSLKAASVQAGGSGESPQKIFRRQDILRLMMTDRERYLALEPEIRQAYAEGRVRG